MCKYDEVYNPIIYKDEALTWENGKKLIKYDNNGIRLNKINNSYTTRYYYEGENLLLEDSDNVIFCYLIMEVKI